MIASSKRTPHAALVAAVLVIGAMASARVASADGGAPPSEEQIEAARVLYREARELRRQGKTKEALDRILEAYKTASTPVTALEAGHMLADAGRLVQARDIVRSVSLLPVSPRESDKGRDARQEALALAAALDARVPKIAVAERPAGVDVLLDGKPLPPGDSNAWQGVDPGAHALVVRVNDRPCTTVTVTLTEGEARTVDFHDVAATCRNDDAAAERAASGRDRVSAPSAATSAVGTTTAAPTNDATWRWAGVAIAGAGVLAVGAGGIVALGAKSDYDAVAGACPPRGCSQSAFDARESARSRADVASVVMGVGALAVAGGAVLFFVNPGGKGAAAAGRARTVYPGPSLAVGLGSIALTIRTQ